MRKTHSRFSAVLYILIIVYWWDVLVSCMSVCFSSRLSFRCGWGHIFFTLYSSPLHRVIHQTTSEWVKIWRGIRLHLLSLQIHLFLLTMLLQPENWGMGRGLQIGPKEAWEGRAIWNKFEIIWDVFLASLLGSCLLEHEGETALKEVFRSLSSDQANVCLPSRSCAGLTTGWRHWHSVAHLFWSFLDYSLILRSAGGEKALVSASALSSSIILFTALLEQSSQQHISPVW